MSMSDIMNKKSMNKKKGWLWFMGLYFASVLIVAGASYSLRFFLHHLA